MRFQFFCHFPAVFMPTILMQACSFLPFLDSSRKQVYFAVCVMIPLTWPTITRSFHCRPVSRLHYHAAPVLRPHHSARKQLQVASLHVQQQTDTDLSWNKGACSYPAGYRHCLRHMHAISKITSLVIARLLLWTCSYYRNSPASCLQASHPYI